MNIMIKCQKRIFIIIPNPMRAPHNSAIGLIYNETMPLINHPLYYCIFDLTYNLLLFKWLVQIIYPAIKVVTVVR